VSLRAMSLEWLKTREKSYYDLLNALDYYCETTKLHNLNLPVSRF